MYIFASKATYTQVHTSDSPQALVVRSRAGAHATVVTHGRHNHPTNTSTVIIALIMLPGEATDENHYCIVLIRAAIQHGELQFLVFGSIHG